MYVCAHKLDKADGLHGSADLSKGGGNSYTVILNTCVTGTVIRLFECMTLNVELPREHSTPVSEDLRRKQHVATT